MTLHSEHDAHSSGEHEHHGSLSTYLSVAVALVILTACSYATFTPLWTAVVGDSVAVKRTWMMAVSCSKAMLVIMFFMHLMWEANWKWVLTIPASCMSIFLGLALIPDVGWRQDTGFAKYSDTRLVHTAEPDSDSPTYRNIQEREGHEAHAAGEEQHH